MNALAPHMVEVRVIWGDPPVLLWRRMQPAWNKGNPDDYSDHEPIEIVDGWRVPWDYRDGKEMRRAGFRHK